MAECVQIRETLYQQALDSYQHGEWEQVIHLLDQAETQSDETRTLRAAACWQSALAQMYQRTQNQGGTVRKAPSATESPAGLRILPPFLITANVLIYGALLLIVLSTRGDVVLPPLPTLLTPTPAQPLAQAASAALEAQEWDRAIAILSQLSEMDPTDEETASQLSFALEQRRLNRLFTQAKGYYQRQLWLEAMAGFQQLRQAAPLFHAEEVTHYLCQTYIQTTRAQVNAAAGDIKQLLPLQTRLTSYAAECSGNEFWLENKLLELYVAGIEAVQLGHWADAMTFFEQIRKLEPTYASDQIAQQLYVARVKQGDMYARQGKWTQALEAYNAALALGVPDQLQAGERRIRAVEALAASQMPEAQVSD